MTIQFWEGLIVKGPIPQEFEGIWPWHGIDISISKPIINFMKPIFLMYFSLIVVTSLIFAVVYVSFTDVVESNPESFSIGMVVILLVGMYGMMDNIISNTTANNQNLYE